MKTLETPLIDGFRLLNLFFQSHKIRYCLIGGIAAGYWGEPRYTRDMDFTVVSHSRSLKDIAALLKNENFKVVGKSDDQIRVVQKGALKFDGDILFGETDYEDWVIQRAVIVPIFDINVSICSPEDLIILKLIAYRRQDLLDIENILKRHEFVLDAKYLSEWIHFWKVNERFQSEFGKDYPQLKERIIR